MINGTELVLLDHAVAYGGEGIVVGTLTGIPEPGSVGLMAGSFLMLLGRRRRR